MKNEELIFSFTIVLKSCWWESPRPHFSLFNDSINW